jgi:outer membrane protein assembly factor BamB
MFGLFNLCRCTFKLALFAALLVGCGPSTPPSAAKIASDWPRFLGPLGIGASPETGIRTEWTGGLRILWQLPVGEGYSAPTIADGRFFHFDRHKGQARLTAFNPETAAETWRFEYPTDFKDKYGYDGGPRACPVVDGDRVYIYGPEGMLHCLDAADGKPRWKVDTQSTYGVVQNFFGVASVPVIENDLLIVAVGGSPAGAEPDDFRELKGNGTGLVAFDKLTGKERYRTTDELASYCSPTVTEIGGRRLGLYWGRNRLVAFEPATGKPVFQFPWRSKKLESVNAANPVVVGDRVLLTECYGNGSVLLRIGTNGPEVVWQDDPDSRIKRLECHFNTPIHLNGYVYGSSGRQDDSAELRCIKLDTGEVRWREPVSGRSSLMLVDGHFLVWTEFGQLILMKPDPTRFVEVARMDLGWKGQGIFRDRCWAAPVLAHGRLYVRGPGRIICLELIPQK